MNLHRLMTLRDWVKLRLMRPSSWA